MSSAGTDALTCRRPRRPDPSTCAHVSDRAVALPPVGGLRCRVGALDAAEEQCQEDDHAGEGDEQDGDLTGSGHRSTQDGAAEDGPALSDPPGPRCRGVPHPAAP